MTGTYSNAMAMMVGSASRSTGAGAIPVLSTTGGANRCRADSSGSTFSSSSDNSSNRSKTSSRRRSHRPRGCRGGSSRKKRRGVKVPKEIVGSPVVADDSTTMTGTTATIAAKSGATATVTTFHRNNESGEVIRDNTTSLQGPGQVAVVTTSDVTNVNRTLQQQDHKISDENSGRGSSQQSFNNIYNNTGTKYVPLTSNAAVYGDKKGNDATEPVKPPKGGILSSQSCLPPLKDSLKSLITRENTTHNQKGRLHVTTVGQGSNFVLGGCGVPQTQILPPLYHTTSSTEKATYHHPPRGGSTANTCTSSEQNIYALQNSHSSHIGGSYNNNNNNSNSNSNNMPSNNNSYHYMDSRMHNNCNPLCGYDSHNQDRHSSYGMQQHDQRQYHQTNNIGNNKSNSKNSHGSAFVCGNYEVDFPSFYAENQRGVVNNNNNNNNNSYTTTTTTSSSSSSSTSIHKSEKIATNTNTNNSTTAAAAGSNTNNKQLPGVAYRIERIEKQRQMMAQGGSLFVVSPRSFLMGMKRGDGSYNTF